MLFHERNLCNYLSYQLIQIYIYIYTLTEKTLFLLLINIPTRFHVRLNLLRREIYMWEVMMSKSCTKMETENSCWCLSQFMQRNVISNAFFWLPIYPSGDLYRLWVSRRREYELLTPFCDQKQCSMRSYQVNNTARDNLVNNISNWRSLMWHCFESLQFKKIYKQKFNNELLIIWWHIKRTEKISQGVSVTF